MIVAVLLDRDPNAVALADAILRAAGQAKPTPQENDMTKMTPEQARESIIAGTAPEGLTVGGWLDLSGCTGLTALPEGLTVNGKICGRPA